MSHHTAADRKGRPISGHAHGHFWIMGVVGVLAGAAMMIFLPQMKIASTSILLFAGFHVVGGIVLLSSAWVVGLRGLVRRLRRPKAAPRPPRRWISAGVRAG